MLGQFLTLLEAAGGVTLLLVRHGQSAGNARRVFSGSADVPLTATGRAQAAALADRLAHEPIAAVYASPLSRARDTARPTAEPSASK